VTTAARRVIFQGVRTAAWLIVVFAIGAIARADEPTTGTVIVSCNEADASLIVDGVLIPERTPAVLTLPSGAHVIEARKPSLVPDKKVVQVTDQQPVKVRFELLPPAPLSLPAGSDAGSAAPPAGSAAPPAGSAAAPPPATGSGAGSGSAALPIPTPIPAVATKPASRCMEGGHEVSCIQGPHCTEGGKLVPCKKGDPMPGQPPPQPPPTTAAAVVAGAGAGSNAHAEPPRGRPSGVEIATSVAHAIAYVDGAPIHDAPCVLELEPGEHVIAVYATGMVPAESVVRVEAGKRQRVELNPATQRGRIDVPAQ
jgi:hypothetical protein